MPPKVVTYTLEDSTTVRFEIDPPAGFQEAGTEGNFQITLTWQSGNRDQDADQS